MSLLMVWLNRTPEPPAYPRCSTCRHVADPHGPAPGRMRLHLSLTRAHGAEATPHEWICPACGYTAPLSTGDYATVSEPRRCRRWYCRLEWMAPPEVERPACPRCYSPARAR
ncbi:hypothetical protein ACOQFV_07550 [Nocardiopsis changdeensis]|uniref:Zinc-ribbon domain-containing protein n=1 Tax=Nocardiopsis changdeensis TaxID=2831969 RepID=A0ABX8BGU9_9ACTN|nr:MULTISPECIES: hypothetical protein [Nocardiopsis]QUX20579.1 hypothetical protein KGD84_18920 [Nocardiopsis changdeensis]QYX36510.1 hypothetical protein K1J57_28375 [Nocardiopsis sp. MT53]